MPGGPLFAGLPAGEEVHEVAEALDHPESKGPPGQEERHDRLRVGDLGDALRVTVSVISSPAIGQAEVTRAACPSLAGRKSVSQAHQAYRTRPPDSYRCAGESWPIARPQNPVTRPWLSVNTAGQLASVPAAWGSPSPGQAGPVSRAPKLRRPHSMAVPASRIWASRPP